MNFDEYEKICFWCGVKASLIHKEKRIPLRQGEIWWCNLGMNVGEESYGKGSRFTRPVLILKKLTGNSFLGLPLTSKKKEGSWYAPIVIGENQRWVMLNQARILDGKRLVEHLGTIGIADFEAVKEKFHNLYCL